MKNIAVLVYDLTIEYSGIVLNGIFDFFKDKDDVNLIISPVNVPLSNSSEFDYQYWTSVKVLNSQNIDGFIVLTNSFLAKVSVETLSAGLKELSPKPVVSVSAPLNIPGSKYIRVSCEDAYEKIVEHLVQVHGCKKIAFFTAAMTYSKDSEERFAAYKNALKKFNLEFYPEFVLDGDFTSGVAKEKFLERFKTKDDIRFDAILCANDYTAAGVLTALEELKIKCPRDLLIFGYDDTEIALACYPMLSTINQKIEKTGEKAAETIYNVLNDKETDEYCDIFSEPVFRQSCGCGGFFASHSVSGVSATADNFDVNNIDFDRDNKNKNIIADGKFHKIPL